MSENDEIWKPGYQGPAPISEPIRLPSVAEPDPEREPEPTSVEQALPTDQRGRRSASRIGLGTVAVVVAVVAVSIGVAVLVTPSDDEHVDSTVSSVEERYELPDIVATTSKPFAGATPRRLPATLDPIWSRQLGAADGADVWVEVIDRRFVLVAISDDQALANPSTVLQSLDAETGDSDWSIDLGVPSSSVAFVAENAGSISLIVNGAITGIDAATGDAVWSLDGVAAVTETSVVQLVGTNLLALRSADGTSTLLDMTTGDTVGQLDGPIVSANQPGTVFVRQGSSIMRYDLANGYRAPTVIASAVDGPVVAVVGSDAIASGPQGWTAWGASGEPTPPEHVVLEVAGDLPTVAAILPMLGTTFVVAGEGAIVGADLDGEEIRTAWERDGTVTAMYPTERGFLVHAASQGGADQTIYDGRNGNAVATLTMTPGLFDALVVTGNGILTKKFDVDGPRLAALDLDGNEMWALRGVTAAAVGDRLIVTTTMFDDGSILLDAVGELPDE